MTKSGALDMAELAPGEPTQVIAVASANTGAGKTTVAINLATALANRGHNIMLLDGNAGAADVKASLGLQPLHDLGDVLRGEQPLDNILLPGPSGISVVLTAAGNSDNLDRSENAAVIGAFEQLKQTPDVLVIDTTAGITESSKGYAQAACEVLVVIGSQHGAITDAHRLIHALHSQCKVSRFRILVNRVSREANARNIFAELSRQVDYDISVALHYIGHIPNDSGVRRALGAHQPVVNLAPRSPSALAFKQLARRTENWPTPLFNGGGVRFFVERLARRAAAYSDLHPNQYPKEVA